MNKDKKENEEQKDNMINPSCSNKNLKKSSNPKIKQYDISSIKFKYVLIELWLYFIKSYNV